MPWFMVSIYFVCFGDVLHQIVGIPMGTNSAPLIADYTVVNLNYG